MIYFFQENIWYFLDALKRMDASTCFFSEGKRLGSLLRRYDISITHDVEEIQLWVHSLVGHQFHPARQFSLNLTMKVSVIVLSPRQMGII
jgi:hypothetical protein